TELVILPLENRDARLAWHTTFYTELQGGMPPGLWSYFVDAKTGEILQHYNTLDTATVVEASGPGGNAKVSRSWTNLDVVQSGSSYVMNPDAFETTNLNHATSGTGTPFSSSSLTGFSDPAANDAHGFAEATIHMLHDWMGYNSIDNQGFKILSR